jgi:hypothetical protein
MIRKMRIRPNSERLKKKRKQVASQQHLREDSRD